MVGRVEIVQFLLSQFDQPRYLEIGVNQGMTFCNVSAAEKTGVDPHFSFNTAEYLKRNRNIYLENMSSDVFFSTVCSMRKFDVIFLDGLHEFNQTLRDLFNSINFLSENGIIVLDDILPNSYYSSISDLATSKKVREILGIRDKSWMGDVYRVVFFIASFLQQYSYATVADSHGLMIVWKQQRDSAQLYRLSATQCAEALYERTILEKEVYNFAPWDTLQEMIPTFISGRNQ